MAPRYLVYFIEVVSAWLFCYVRYVYIDITILAYDGAAIDRLPVRFSHFPNR
jgi:hypothetical protein